MGRRLGAALGAAVLSVLLGLACVVGSARTLSMTLDEPNHVAAGLEWIQHGTYTMWTENPPLPRVAVALGPYLAGSRLPGPEAWQPGRTPFYISWQLGADALYGQGTGVDAHLRNVGRARLPGAVFFLLAVLFSALLAARRGGWAAGAIAAAATATLPPLLGHAALATTDVAFLAAFLGATWAFARWLDLPSWGRTAALGLATGAALLCKFTTLPFLPLVALAYAAPRMWAGRRRGGGHGRRWRWATLAGACALAALTVWAGYRFSYGRVIDPRFMAEYSGQALLPPAGERSALERLLAERSLPAPEFFHGLLHLRAHNRVGHPAYLLGEIRQSGFPWFYPVVLFFKTPLPLLVLLAGGIAAALAARRREGSPVDLAPGVAALAILAVLAGARMNLGVRHALVVYPLLIATASTGLSAWRAGLAGRPRTIVGLVCAALLVGLQGIALATRSDHLAYFNALAGREPGRIVVDSDLDWNQGYHALAVEARRRSIGELKIATRVSGTRLCQEGLPPLVPLAPHQPTRGWIAISENLYWGRTESWTLRDVCRRIPWGEAGATQPPGWFRWLRAHQPVWRGGGLRLYFLGPGSGGGPG